MTDRTNIASKLAESKAFSKGAFRGRAEANVSDGR